MYVCMYVCIIFTIYGFIKLSQTMHFSSPKLSSEIASAVYSLKPLESNHRDSPATHNKTEHYPCF